MTAKMERLLKEFENSCTTEGNAIADCLRTISGNGGEMGTTPHLLSCANELRAWATRVLEAYKQEPKIVVIVEGGIVQDVFTDASTWYTVIDYDNEEGAERSRSYQTQALSKLDPEVKELL